MRAQSAELSKKRQNLEAQLGDAQMRLKEASGKASELLGSQTKLQVMLTSIVHTCPPLCGDEIVYDFLQ